MSDEPHKYSLRWRNHTKSLLEAFKHLFNLDLLTDLTLMVEGGRMVLCHKMVLAASSTAFHDLLLKNPEATSVVLPGVTYPQMRSLLQYMYSGEVQICYSELDALLKVAEMLKIKGLITEEECSASPSTSLQVNSPPPTISTSSSIVNKSAQSTQESPPHSTGNVYDYYKYPAFNMPAFPTLPGFQIPHYAAAAAAAAAAASEYYGALSLDKYKDTPILRNVLHQNSHEEAHLANAALLNADKEQGPVASSSSRSRTSSFADEDRSQIEEKPRNASCYKVKKELMERVQQQQQQCQSTDNTSTPAKTGKQKVDWKRYKQYSPDDLKMAILAVVHGEMSALKASQIYSVPSRTLYDKIKRLKVQQNQNGLTLNGMKLKDTDSACFPYGIGRNVNGRIYKKRSYSPRNFASLLTPENLGIMNEDSMVAANMNASVCSDILSSSSHSSPPDWQQVVPKCEEDSSRFNLSPAHSASSRHSVSDDCDVAEDLSINKNRSTPTVKEENNEVVENSDS